MIARSRLWVAQITHFDCKAGAVESYFVKLLAMPHKHGRRENGVAASSLFRGSG
jgi:hypothetical protein